ncbi:hypothetical protein MtrunA17_Chr8g0341651 [Medicago truncatula]|uniref:Transmembrane protein n=1 Tax=Medicago truncatula TaxID=3880 RepID=A0A396GCL0_MEDTR|nr:hypothetical protein MtrunA17_Chr8g0341651 [Medicago truncatula]
MLVLLFGFLLAVATDVLLFCCFAFAAAGVFSGLPVWGFFLQLWCCAAFEFWVAAVFGRGSRFFGWFFVGSNVLGVDVRVCFWFVIRICLRHYSFDCSVV